MSSQKELLTTNRKALTINLDPLRYGTFAEIGAGQEVARYFFQAGGAAGTVAKSISAYDMVFSDAIYGRTRRYVSRERLLTMLAHEYDLLIERLSGERGERSAFFVFADTVSAKSYHRSSDGHGWLGMRFQIRPQEEPDDIILHVRMWDKENVLQQQALGIIGVNLIYGAFYYHDHPERFIRSLLDNLSAERIEVDMLTFTGPAFRRINNRTLSLQLVRDGMTNAVLFDAHGDAALPSDVLYKKAVLLERGSFRPVTRVHIDMLESAASQFIREPALKDRDMAVLTEISLEGGRDSAQVDASDVLARVDLLSSLGYLVLISNYSEYYRLSSYFRRFTPEMIGVVLGIDTLLQLFDERRYDDLPGGILESFGRLFRNGVKLYAYPMLADTLRRRQAARGRGPLLGAAADGAQADRVVSARDLRVVGHLRHLYAHLLENGFVQCLERYTPSALQIFSRDVLEQIRRGESHWEEHVPDRAAALIKENRYFGYGAGGAPEPAQRS